MGGAAGPTARRFLKSISIPREAVARVEDRDPPGPHGPVSMRIYWPREAGDGGDDTGALPLLLHFHGSGFVLGGLDSHDALCRTLCNQAGCIVAAVDYRKAPEHKFPAGIDDCWAATEWAAANAPSLNGDPTRIAVFGDSTGGNNAAVIAQRAREAGGPALALQVLVYPPLDLAAVSASYETFGEGYNLTAPAMRWFIEQYLRDEADRADPRASPLVARELGGLAPAFGRSVTIRCAMRSSPISSGCARRRCASNTAITPTCFTGSGSWERASTRRGGRTPRWRPRCGPRSRRVDEVPGGGS